MPQVQPVPQALKAYQELLPVKVLQDQLDLLGHRDQLAIQAGPQALPDPRDLQDPAVPPVQPRSFLDPQVPQVSPGLPDLLGLRVLPRSFPGPQVPQVLPASDSMISPAPHQSR